MAFGHNRNISDAKINKELEENIMKNLTENLMEHILVVFVYILTRLLLKPYVVLMEHLKLLLQLVLYQDILQFRLMSNHTDLYLQHFW